MNDTLSPTSYIANENVPNSTLLTEMTTELHDSNDMKNNNNQFITSHLISIYSIIGVLLLVVIIFIICNGIIYWKKINKYDAVPNRWKSIDTQTTNTTKISTGNNNSNDLNNLTNSNDLNDSNDSPTIGTAISIADESPFYE